MNTEKVAKKICKEVLEELGFEYVEGSDEYLTKLVEKRLKKEIKHDKNRKRRKAKRLKLKNKDSEATYENGYIGPINKNGELIADNTTYTVAYVVSKLTETIEAIYTADDREDFGLSITHQGSDGEYETFYFTGELSYESFEEAFDHLNLVVQEIDEDAYFDMEDTGRAVCLISKDKFIEPVAVIEEDPGYEDEDYENDYDL